MRVSIKVNPKAAAELHGEVPASERKRRLSKTASGAGTTLQPMHPGTDDAELRTYFYADVDDDRVEELVNGLRKSEDIEGVYIKPPDALP